MDNLKRELKDVELLQSIQKELETGQLVIVDIRDTKNDSMSTIYVAQLAELPTSNDVTEFEAMALGWNTKAILRALFTADKELAKPYGKGTMIKDAQIQILDSFTPDYEEHGPRIAKDGSGVRCANDTPIYRSTRVMFTEEFEKKGGHSTIDYNKTMSLEDYDRLEKAVPAIEGIAMSSLISV